MKSTAYLIQDDSYSTTYCRGSYPRLKEAVSVANKLSLESCIRRRIVKTVTEEVSTEWHTGAPFRVGEKMS